MQPNYVKTTLSALALGLSLSSQAINLSPTPSFGIEESYLQTEVRLQEWLDSGTPFIHSFSPVPMLLSNSQARGTAFLDLANKQIRAEIQGLAAGQLTDLWLIKNVAGEQMTALPESGDQMLKVGEFDGQGQLFVAQAEALLAFNFDHMVVTERGIQPDHHALAMGARTLHEKRFFAQVFGQALDEPNLAANDERVASDNQLVQLGANVFFEETFAGNGRTCGTCHPATNNLTIDAAFIATLANDDPLFVAENNGQLAKLEQPQLMREFGLILENVDGFDDPENKFVMRSVNHTFSMTNSMHRHAADVEFQVDHNPDQRLGWGGDGAPGRGTLTEFTFGAINQHFPQSLARISKLDFRIPTQLELDALEAFQLFLGRQSEPDFEQLTFREPLAEAGKNAQGACNACHKAGGAGDNTFGNLIFNTGVNDRPSTLAMNLPFDNGYKDGQAFSRTSGSNSFNVPPLIEAADTAPFFHNNSAQTLEEVLDHYAGEIFANSDSGRQFDSFGLNIQLNRDNNRAKFAAFLRAINVAENLRLVRSRLAFLKANPQLSGEHILTLCESDLKDVIEVLSQQAIYPQVKNQAQLVLDVLASSASLSGNDKSDYYQHMIDILLVSRDYLFSDNPLAQF